MNVERPRARSSAAPTRENSRSMMPIRAREAGTKLPICAISAISAFWRRKVDLPAMLGPVISQIWPDFCSGPGERSQALAINGWPLCLSACSTTGWRPPSIAKLSELSTSGRT